ncbi:putative DNA-polymerase zeta catalytic subunit [Sesbania bispinosa]|nr:putative DNA-polymerase zeta catalytic subunit [Sesbania bispinosa]
MKGFEDLQQTQEGETTYLSRGKLTTFLLRRREHGEKSQVKASLHLFFSILVLNVLFEQDFTFFRRQVAQWG